MAKRLILAGIFRVLLFFDKKYSEIRLGVFRLYKRLIVEILDSNRWALGSGDVNRFDVTTLEGGWAMTF